MPDSKIEPPGIRAKRLGLEWKAISDPFCDWTGRREPHGASEGEVETSKAISLKRIADLLEKQGEPLNVCATVEEREDSTAKTNSLLGDIAEHLGTLAGELAHPEWGIAPTLRKKP